MMALSRSVLSRSLPSFRGADAGKPVWQAQRAHLEIPDRLSAKAVFPDRAKNFAVGGLRKFEEPPLVGLGGGIEVEPGSHESNVHGNPGYRACGR